MNSNAENLLLCACGRSFTESGPLKNHRKGCRKAKSQLIGVLEKARESWTARKRRRLEDLEEPSGSNVMPAPGPINRSVDVNIVCFAVHEPSYYQLKTFLFLSRSRCMV
jgi:hypothetical protein